MENLIDELENNKNSNGGGLASNITGKFESNRHAIAKMTKYTFGQVAKELRTKRGGGFDLTGARLLEIYRTVFGDPEWHHAGKMPRGYGGAMAKTYFLEYIPTKEEVNDWISEYYMIISRENEKRFKQMEIEKERKAFVEKMGSTFTRELEIPKYSHVTKVEMNGKFGWFEPQPHHSYKLDEYYTGVSFKSQKSLDKYLNIK